MAGLSAGWTLHQKGIPVTVLEKNEYVGGVVRSVRMNDHLFERGPTTVLSHSQRLRELIDEVDLRPRLLLSHSATARRLVWRCGQLHEFPTGPMGLLRTGLLSWGGKLRVLTEPFIRPPAEPADETLEVFMRRRVGQEAVDAMVDPMVAGVYAGRVDRLGAEAFPTLLAMERSYGSLWKGLRMGRKAQASQKPVRSRRGNHLLSFPQGLQELPEAIRRRLGTRVRLLHDVFAIERGKHPTDPPWQVVALADDHEVRYNASAVIIATPAVACIRILERLEEGLGAPLKPLPYVGVATVGLGYPREASQHQLDAFGFLCARDGAMPSGSSVLGVLFNSSIFQGRAPNNHITLTAVVGGAREAGITAFPDSVIVDRVREALGIVLGVRGAPSAICVTRWDQAIPQYQPGHQSMIEALLGGIEAFPGLKLAGNYLEGVGLEAVAASGTKAARSLLNLVA
jgi:oxygen-dependent protoporphyrinogen oxidase